MSSSDSTQSRFLGNLEAQGYTGEDGTANAVADGFGVGVSAVYAGLAKAAGEVDGPIGTVGNLVNVAVGVTTAGTVCNLVGVAAGNIAGGAAGALTLPTGPIVQFIVGTAASLTAQKAATALCQTAEGYVNGKPAHASLGVIEANNQVIMHDESGNISAHSAKAEHTATPERHQAHGNVDVTHPDNGHTQIWGIDKQGTIDPTALKDTTNGTYAERWLDQHDYQRHARAQPKNI